MFPSHCLKRKEYNVLKVTSKAQEGFATPTFHGSVRSLDDFNNILKKFFESEFSTFLNILKLHEENHPRKTYYQELF